MALNQYISVKVCGNPDSNSGFVPILLFNSPSFAVEDQFYVGFDNCSYFYTIKTARNQTIYKLVKNNVRSYGAARAGSLVIAFSVPKNYSIEGGYTPYDVLEKLKNEFLKKCMTCKDPVRETYEFNSGRIDLHVLDEVASEFTISPSPSPNRVMNDSAPKGYIVKSDAEIEKLFHDLNYPEFDNYSEVIVAESVNQTSYTLINNIQIPRPKSYAIYVDGVFKMACTDITETIAVPINSSSEYYENKNVRFTIQNLKDGDILPGIELQDVNERVLISTRGWATPKTRKIELKIVPSEFENYFFTNRNLLKVTWPYGIIRLDQDMSFTIEGEQIAEIKKGTIKVSLEQNSKFTLSKYEISGNELRVIIEEIKRQVVQHPQSAEKVTDPQIIKSSPVYDVSILLRGKDKFEESNEIDVKLKTDSDNSKLTTIATCFTKFKPQLKSNEVFEGHFYVPRDLQYASYPNIYLYFRIKESVYVTEYPLIFNNDKVVVKDSDFVISKVKPFYKNKSFLVNVMAILFGLTIGYASHDGIKGLFDRITQSIGTLTHFYDKEDMSEEKASDFLKDADNVLKSENLKFSEVKDVYEKYMELKTTIDDVDEKQPDVCARIRDYNEVISYVTNGDVKKLERALDLIQRNKLHVWPIHANILKQIVNNEITKEQFHNNYSTILAFDQISSAIALPHFKCEVCGNVLETQEELAEHTKSHESITYACDKCSEVFDSKEKLNQHKSTTHTSAQSQKKRFVCPKCGDDVWFDSEGGLKGHLKSKHER